MAAARARAAAQAMPVIGVLARRSPATDRQRLRSAFRQGLRSWLSSKARTCDRIPLGGRRSRQLPRAGGRSGRESSRDRSGRTLAARCPSRDHDNPDRLRVGGDPVGAGSCPASTDRAATSPASLSNTAVTGQKRLELLREIVPQARRLSASAIPTPESPEASRPNSGGERRARGAGIGLQILDAPARDESIERASRRSVQRGRRARGSGDPIFTHHRVSIVAHACARTRFPRSIRIANTSRPAA